MNHQTLRVDATGVCTTGTYTVPLQKARDEVNREPRVRQISRPTQPDDLAPWVMRLLALGLVLFVLVLLVLHG